MLAHVEVVGPGRGDGDRAHGVAAQVGDARRVQPGASSDTTATSAWPLVTEASRSSTSTHRLSTTTPGVRLEVGQRRATPRPPPPPAAGRRSRRQPRPTTRTRSSPLAASTSAERLLVVLRHRQHELPGGRGGERVGHDRGVEDQHVVEHQLRLGARAAVLADHPDVDARAAGRGRSARARRPPRPRRDTVSSSVSSPSAPAGTSSPGRQRAGQGQRRPGSSSSTAR